jgi:hypothetical protein
MLFVTLQFLKFWKSATHGFDRAGRLFFWHRRRWIRRLRKDRYLILSTGCLWGAVPKNLPPRSTLFDYLDLWSWDGTLNRIHHALYVECREHDEREASPTAAIIDSQSVKSAEKGGPPSIRMAICGQKATTKTLR